MSKKRAMEAAGGPACPCCLDRQHFTGSRKFAASATSTVDLCSVCVDIDSWDAPPFIWPSSAAEIEASSAEVLKAAEANLEAVAAADPPTFASVIYPLMAPPNYKTNPLLCQSKFLQHCSTNAEVRDAAEEAGKKFAAFKAKSRPRADILAKVQAFAATPEAKALGPYESHYVQALLKDFERGGLALPEAKRAELQKLLDADAEVCSKYGSNLGSDSTKITFAEEDLKGMAPSWIADRKGEDGRVTATLK